MQDDGGDVLGNLPRSRPGRRSEKRTGSGRAPKKAGKQAASSSAKRTTAKKRPPAAKRSTPPKRSAPESRPAGGNPVEDAVRAATRVAETGLRVAEGVTREVLRRLPRP